MPLDFVGDAAGVAQLDRDRDRLLQQIAVSWENKVRESAVAAGSASRAAARLE